MSTRGKPLSRRAVLRGLGGTVVTLPFLDAMVGVGRQARAQSTSFPKRFVVWYTPNGTVPVNFWPSGRDVTETEFPLSPILEPLAAHKQDLLICRGINMDSSKTGPGDAHQKGTGHCLTGTALQSGDFPGDSGQSAGWADNESIDQRIASHIGTDNLFRSLEFGVLTRGASVRSRISYRGPGQPLPPNTDPYAMYNRLFGDPGITPEERMRQTARRQVVLDAIAGEYGRLRSRLGSDDRLKLDNHVTSIQSIQDRLGKNDIEFGGACQRLDIGDQEQPIDVARTGNMPEVGRLQMDLMAMSFACDLTRVASLVWTESTSDAVYSWLGNEFREGHHSLAHKSDTDAPKVAQNTAINRWHAEQLAYFIDKLKAIPEGDGTVFDNTVIFWTNEQSRGNNHSRDDMPYLLAGSGGGYFNTGRFVTQASPVPHNRLLVALLQAYGIEEEAFGDPQFGSGAITGLT